MYLDFNGFVGCFGLVTNDSTIDTNEYEENDESKDARNECHRFDPHGVAQES